MHQWIMWEWRTVDKIPQQHIMCMFIRGGFLTCHLRPPNNNSDIRMDFTEQHRCGICMYGMIRLYPVWLPRRWDYINSSILPDNSVELSHPTYNNVSDGEDNTPVTQLGAGMLLRRINVGPYLRLIIWWVELGDRHLLVWRIARELHVVYLCAIISCTFCFQFNA